MSNQDCRVAGRNGLRPQVLRFWTKDGRRVRKLQKMGNSTFLDAFSLPKPSENLHEVDRYQF